MGKNITTPDNIKFGDLPADAKMKILKILTISSFNLQKYSESIEYGIKLFENLTWNFKN